MNRKYQSVAAFETWHGGHSALYTLSDDGPDQLDHFIDGHFNSDTFATLHLFSNEGRAREIYRTYLNN